MRAHALSDASQRIWQIGEHALVGISAGNGYFNQKRLTALLQWAAYHFKNVDVVYVDTHIDDMQIADGRAPQEAAKSVKRTLKDVRRRIQRAAESLGPEIARLRIRPLSEIQDITSYRTVRARVDRAVQEDPVFAAACQDMVRTVVKGHPGRSGGATEAHLRAGMNYVMAEAPLFVDSPSVFGVATSTLCYHMSTPVTAHFAGRPAGYSAAEGQGYVVVKPDEPDPDGAPGARPTKAVAQGSQKLFVAGDRPRIATGERGPCGAVTVCRVTPVAGTGVVQGRRRA
ncbi:tRNA-dependent cyclodipeptide synthase [Streptomyces sp. NEAU-S7GS2]|uniref:tRNA-dependent cyclodipeptide synthase n=1 Tax=Streptomyces sp. NEAU-S7GS2 TaxID=2202000 RepID=UPI001EF58B43|nr:tRNA-dependent cyclodipeptide synthase [Streptomyces sp. NEAU-S7GS2]